MSEYTLTIEEKEAIKNWIETQFQWELITKESMNNQLRVLYTIKIKND